MIDRIPLEILLHCLSYLPLNEKLECLRVNKSTYNVIHTSDALYESVTITNLEDFTNMHTFFTKYKELSKHVKKLHISDTTLDVNTYMALPALFPNVKDFSFIDTDNPERDYDDKKVCAAFKPWAETLLSLQEFGTPVAAFSLLANVACPQLRNLSLNMIGMEDEEAKFALYDYLENCPNVRLLDLKYLNTTIDHMEQIHDHLPNLEVLSLTQVGLPENDSDEDPPNQAEKLETVFISDFTVVTDFDGWLLYMALKYPNLKNLVVGKALDMYDEEVAFEGDYQWGLLELVSTNSKLELFSPQCLQLPPIAFKKMDAAGIKLKKIELSILAEETFPLLMQSQQIHSLISLTISNTSYSSMTYRNKSKFHQDLKKIKNLKHFRINQSKEEVNSPEDNRVPLDDLLKVLPSLESMQMDFFTLVISRKSKKPFNTKLKKLVLEEVYVEALAVKGQENWKQKSKDLLQELLPNTDIEYRELGDTPELEEYSHLLQFR